MGLGAVIPIDAITEEDVRNAQERLATHQPTGTFSCFCNQCGMPSPCVTANYAVHVVAAAKTAGLIRSDRPFHSQPALPRQAAVDGPR